MSAPGPPSIAVEHLHELWVHTGTACNLACPFCHEGSKPGDSRIAAPTLTQLAPVFKEAAARGVRCFAFTGGEPLILKGIQDILLCALQLAPALVLTNGTAPFIRRAHQLAQLHTAPHRLTFRVSIDYPEEARHDAGRGLKNFRKALEGLRVLHAAGFAVGITRQITAGEDAQGVATRFRQLLRKHRLPEDLPVVALPDLAALGDSDRLDGTTHALPESPHAPAIQPACARGRMLVMRDGDLRLHACPLTDDQPRFDTGDALGEALATAVIPDHPRCSVCLNTGVDYAGMSARAFTGGLAP
ncbi:MAG TPA: radical SAM protein [Steroidobacteraceae bacterium]|nr:radical SAM protein [Steroidobacteraceae bacterium]